MNKLQGLSMEGLTSHYNLLVHQAVEAGGDTRVYRPVVRFTNRNSGEDRCRELEHAIQTKEIRVRSPNDPATKPPGAVKEPKAAAAKEPRAPRERDPNAAPTIKMMTAEYNALVPRANALGVGAKYHTSDFGSRDGAQKQIDKLKADIEKAENPTTETKPPVTDAAGATVGQVATTA